MWSDQLIKLTVVSVLAIVGLTGCIASTQVRNFTGPDGKPAVSIRCGEMSDCYQKAIELCPAGYNIIGSTSGTLGVPTANGGTLMVPDLSMQVACK